MTLMERLRGVLGKLGRKQARPNSDARAYDVARIDRQHNDWVDSRLDANRETRDALAIARAASRNADRNVGLYHRILEMHKTYIVGPTGFQLKSEPRQTTSKFGPIGGADQLASDAIETHWRRFAASRVTADGQLTLPEMLEQLVLARYRDGEVFVRMLLLEENGSLQLRLQPLESDYVPEYIEDTQAITIDGRRSQRTINGIAVDQYGRPLAYYISKEHPGAEGNGWTRTTGDAEAINAKEVLHYFRPERPGQLRGMPIGVAAQRDLWMLSRYEAAELAAARGNAARPVVIQKTAEAGAWAGDQTETDGRISLDLSENGATLLPVGYEMKWSPVTHPPGNYAPFVTQVTRHIAAACNVSHALLVRDLSQVNFSSMRIEGFDLKRYFTTEQNALIERVLRPVFLKWLEVELLAGRIKIGKGSLKWADFEKHSDARFIAPPFMSVEPLKDLETDKLMVQMNIKTLEEVCLERTGQELDDVLAKRAEEKAKIKALGLTDASELDVKLPLFDLNDTSDEDDGATDSDDPDAEQNDLLNGAQVTALLTVLQSVISGEITKPVAIAILVSTLGIEQENAAGMVNPLKVTGKEPSTESSTNDEEPEETEPSQDDEPGKDEEK
jgi:lambda family phage portal protein